jgi:hypothetical protein
VVSLYLEGVSKCHVLKPAFYIPKTEGGKNMKVIAAVFI